MHSIEQLSTSEPIIQAKPRSPWRGYYPGYDRLLAVEIGDLLTECTWSGMPPREAAEIALSVAEKVATAGAGFGPALAEYLERWARDEGLPEGVPVSGTEVSCGG